MPPGCHARLKSGEHALKVDSIPLRVRKDHAIHGGARCRITTDAGDLCKRRRDDATSDTCAVGQVDDHRSASDGPRTLEREVWVLLFNHGDAVCIGAVDGVICGCPRILGEASPVVAARDGVIRAALKAGVDVEPANSIRLEAAQACLDDERTTDFERAANTLTSEYVPRSLGRRRRRPSPSSHRTPRRSRHSPCDG